MPCNCGLSHCPECLGWNTIQPPVYKKGSVDWKDNIAFKYCLDRGLLGTRNMIVKLPIVEEVDLGYMAIRYYPGSGTDCFRVDMIDR